MTFTLTIKTAEDLAAEALAGQIAQAVAAIDAHVEAQARALGYNSATSLASYRDATVPAWAAEAQAFIAWRDAVWQAAIALQQQALQQQSLPPLDEVLAAMPDWQG